MLGATATRTFTLVTASARLRAQAMGEMRNRIKGRSRSFRVLRTLCWDFDVHVRTTLKSPATVELQNPWHPHVLPYGAVRMLQLRHGLCRNVDSRGTQVLFKKIRIALDRRSRGCQDEKRQCRDGLRTVRTHNITNLLLSGKEPTWKPTAAWKHPAKRLHMLGPCTATVRAREKTP